MAAIHLFLLAFVAMATQTHQQSTDDVDPSEMTLEQAQNMFRQSFREVDVNHDNLVDLHEFMDAYLVHDHNNDGVVTLAEFLQQAPEEENRETLSADFRFHDTNHDNRITAPEMRAQFNNIDADGNGEITLQEFLAFGTELYEEKAHPAFQNPPVGK